MRRGGTPPGPECQMKNTVDQQSRNKKRYARNNLTKILYTATIAGCGTRKTILTPERWRRVLCHWAINGERTSDRSIRSPPFPKTPNEGTVGRSGRMGYEEQDLLLSPTVPVPNAANNLERPLVAFEIF